MPVRTTPSKVPAPPETVTPSGQRPAAADHVDDDQYDADEKQDPGDLAGDGGDPEQSQRTGNEPDDEKHQRVVQHWASPPPSSECNGNAVGTVGSIARNHRVMRAERQRRRRTSSSTSPPRRHRIYAGTFRRCHGPWRDP